MDTRARFYKRTVGSWLKNRNSKILVVGGGKTDFDILRELGFENVTISNLDERLTGNEFHPFMWSFQDAENLTFKDDEYDHVIVHAALHHCLSPHKAMLEMYRVANQGIIIFESRDSFVMKIVSFLGLTPTYEHVAVYYNTCTHGGVRNTDIPNYIYRWTEREIEKTINCYNPLATHRFRYSYDADAPSAVKFCKQDNYRSILIAAVKPFYYVFVKLFPKQQNLFACYIEKPDVRKDHFPWLTFRDGRWVFNKEWAETKYKKA